MEEPKQKIVEEVKDLCRKADQTRSMFNIMRDDLVCWNKIILSYVTIGSAVTAMLIFAPLQDKHQFLVGIYSATIFIASLIPTTFNFDSKILERTSAVQAWGDWLRNAHNFINVEIHQLDLASASSKQQEILITYKKVMEKTPLIPDDKFNEYKQLHLQKVAISKALDKTPFKTIKNITKELSKEQ